MSLLLFTQAHSRASVHSISTVNWRQILNFYGKNTFSVYLFTE